VATDQEVMDKFLASVQFDKTGDCHKGPIAQEGPDEVADMGTEPAPTQPKLTIPPKVARG
jgi:hypothetical protein